MNREQKGKMLTAVPSDYIGVEIETTGEDPYYDHLLSISAIRYLGGNKVDSFHEEIGKEPNSEKEAIKRFYRFVGNQPLIGYHLDFKINFIYDACMSYLDQPFTNDYLDMKEVIRKMNLIKSNYRLENVSSQLHIEQKQGKEKQVELLHKIMEQLSKDEWDTEHVESMCPFEGRVCVFTGKLQRMDRKAAIALLEQHGGKHGDRVTSKTNYLILGNHDYCSNIESGKSNKQRKAEELQEKGYDIEIISENVYYDMIDVE